MSNDKIEIRDFLIYKGRNIYSHKPVMKIVIDIGRYVNVPTKDIGSFNDKLLKSFPGLATNRCGAGYEGGFLEKLKSGTYLAHVLEHVILELQFMLGCDVRYGKARLQEEPSVYYLVYEYVNEVCGLECGKAAIFIMNCFLNGEDIEIGEFLQYLQKVSVEAELGPSTQAIVDEVKKRGIPVTRIDNKSLVRLGYGRQSRIIESTLTDATSCIAADMTCNKQLTKQILTENHIPVPYGKVVYSEVSAVIAAGQIGYPVVLKPFDGNHGNGVFLDLNSERDIKQAFAQACKFSDGIIVEQYIKGRDFRVLVVGDKVSAVSERLPAMVTGDGVHSIKELVDTVNSDPNRGESHEKPLTKIKLDEVAVKLLGDSGKTADTVPAKGEEVRLRANANLSTGGTAVDFTGTIHPVNAGLAVLAAKSIGIDIAGIDFVTGDIAEPITETGGVIVEVNSAPGIRMHIYPSGGQPQDVAKDIADLLFPPAAKYAFPLVSVTGTNGKTTAVRMIAHVLSQTGKTVGYTSTSGTFIGEKCLYKGDHSGPRSARTLLSNKMIDCAVLETARGGILREGLGYDLADVGVVTNIAEDHLEPGDTLEDIAFIKSLVTEAVKKDGYAVLNADDEMTPYLLEGVRSKKIFFSQNPGGDYPFITGDSVQVFADKEWIYVIDRIGRIDVIRIHDIPVTCGGRIACNIENSLAAVSALYALNLPVNTIEEGLKTFYNSPGRFNFYEVNGFWVLLDYGHNLPGYKEVVKACKNMGFSKLAGVIGVPGDRNDKSIKAIGKYSAEVFDRIYVKEDTDRRGREPKEVAGLLYNEAAAGGFRRDKIAVILNELDALKEAVKNAQKDDLIIVFYEKPEPLQEYLAGINARVKSLEELKDEVRV